MGRAPALEKSTLEWDKGCETLLNALASIPRELDLEDPGARERAFDREHGPRARRGEDPGISPALTSPLARTVVTIVL